MLINNLKKYYLPKSLGWGVTAVIFSVIIFLSLYTNQSNTITYDSLLFSIIYSPLVYIFIVSIYYFFSFTLSLKYTVCVLSFVFFPITVLILPFFLAFSSRSEYHFQSRTYLTIGVLFAIGNFYTSLA